MFKQQKRFLLVTGLVACLFHLATSNNSSASLEQQHRESPCAAIILEEFPDLLEHFRLPGGEDVKADWALFERETGLDSLCVQGDFNRDGRRDLAAILLHRDTTVRGFGLFAFVSRLHERTRKFEYEVWPLHARLPGTMAEVIHSGASRRGSLLDLDGRVIDVGEGWLRLRSPGRYPNLQRCRIRTNVLSLNRTSDGVDYHVDFTKRGMLFYHFFWHVTDRFWRHALCRTHP
jgi:hypothetical protein